MRRYHYKKVDAFAAGKSLGNPAACVYLKANEVLSDDEMLAIAKQHKGFVSEVVFCTDKGNAQYDLIYYSSECEVPFCGHGTIACMYSLIKNTPELSEKEEITISTRCKGALSIYNRIPSQDAVFISAPSPLYLDMNIETAEIAQNLGIFVSAISTAFPIDFIDAGNRTLIVPIVDFNEETSMFPDERMLKEFTLRHKIDVILIFCMEVKNGVSKAHTRVFAAKYGYLEDPATGSANSAFGYYMLKNNMWNGSAITLEQGGNDRVFNTVHLAFSNERLLFGGSAVTRIEGDYLIQ